MDHVECGGKPKAVSHLKIFCSLMASLNKSHCTIKLNEKKTYPKQIKISSRKMCSIVSGLFLFERFYLNKRTYFASILLHNYLSISIENCHNKSTKKEWNWRRCWFVEIYCQQEKRSESENGNGNHLLCIDCLSEVKWMKNICNLLIRSYLNQPHTGYCHLNSVLTSRN